MEVICSWKLFIFILWLSFFSIYLIQMNKLFRWSERWRFLNDYAIEKVGRKHRYLIGAIGIARFRVWSGKVWAPQGPRAVRSSLIYFTNLALKCSRRIFVQFFATNCVLIVDHNLFLIAFDISERVLTSKVLIRFPNCCHFFIQVKIWSW